ncbi:MAG: response regulator transcription factor [Nevskia sp.]
MIRILLVDDHPIVREGYRALLERQPDLRVTGEAADGAEAYESLKGALPDVIVMDLSLPGAGGIDTIRRIRQRWPAAVILAFSMHRSALFARQALQAGARGYVTKSSPPEALVRAIYEVQRGGHALSPDIAQALAIDSLAGRDQALATLSPREFEILRLLIAAQDREAIAAALHISPKTVSNCHYQIKRKLGVATDIELVRLALRLDEPDALGARDSVPT